MTLAYSRRRCRCDHPAFTHAPASPHGCLNPDCNCLGFIPGKDPRSKR